MICDMQENKAEKPKLAVPGEGTVAVFIEGSGRQRKVLVIPH